MDRVGKHVLIAGGTGFIGRHLQQHLRSQGYKVTVISRRPAVGDSVQWAQIDAEGLPRCDALINLCGAGLMDARHTEAYRDMIYASRLVPAKKLVAAIEASSQPPSIYIQQSAVGIYPTHPTKVYKESDAPVGVPRGGAGASEPQGAVAARKPSAGDWCIDLVQKWEEAGKLGSAAASKTRQVWMRSGVVLDASGGALGKVVLPFSFACGGKLGSGRQPYPWIHMEDATGLFLHAIETPTLAGALNAVSPTAHESTNAEYTKAIAEAFGVPAIFALPSFLLKAIFGASRASFLLEGQRVLPQVAVDSGYHWRHPALKAAIDDLLQNA